MNKQVNASATGDKYRNNIGLIRIQNKPGFLLCLAINLFYVVIFAYTL